MFPEKHFAIVKFKTGVLSIEEAQFINNAYKLDPNYSKIFYLLVILSDCKPNFSSKDIHYISEFYNNEFQINNHLCTIWLVDKPLLTAFAHEFVNLIKENSFYCSTIEKAYSLFNFDIPYNEFELLVNSILHE